MECHQSKCNNPIDPNEFCPHCKICYCNEDCRIAHWVESHQFECSEYINFKLEDLKEINDPRLKLLGKGTYGEVKLYKHNSTSVLYAIKIINKEFIKKHSSITVLIREITVHKNLKHPNVIQLIKYFEDTEKVFIVLEYANKGSLFRIIRKQKGLEESKAWQYFSETCLGIKYLHDNGIIHRDLKPENILIDKYDHAKICDFGWCVQSNEIRTTFCGTLEYMAPEMILCEGHSFQVDVWALGILLYELLHGYAPFRAAKDSEKRQQILGNEIAFGPKISSLAKDLILKIVKGNPKDRINLDQILAHPWIVKYAEKYDIEIGGKINHPKHGMGEVIEVTGLVCKVKFNESVEVIAAPDTLNMIIIEKIEPRPTISVMEKDVLNQLELWCSTKTRGRQKNNRIMDKISDSSKDEEVFEKKKRNQSIDCFEEVLERASIRAEAYKENLETKTIEKNKLANMFKGGKNKKINENGSAELVEGNAKKKKKIHNGNIEKVLNKAEGLFDNENEYAKVFEELRKNSKKFQIPCKGFLVIPNSKDTYTKDSTSCQATFDIRNKIDMSELAFESKVEELNKIRRTIDISNAKKKKESNNEAGFWSRLFGCIDR